MNYNISRLREILIEELKSYPGEPIKLTYDEKFLRTLLFNNDSYYGTKFAPGLEEVLKKINFSNVNFYMFTAEDFDFSPYIGIKLNPQTIYNKDLKNSICKGVEFIDSFDNVRIAGTNFTGSKGAKINPQTIYGPNLSNTVCCDVEFIGNGGIADFSRVRLERTNFTGSKGAKINPQAIYYKSLKNCICADVEFVGEYGKEPDFNCVTIDGADFTGSNYEESIKFENEFRQKIRSIKNSKNLIK